MSLTECNTGTTQKLHISSYCDCAQKYNYIRQLWHLAGLFRLRSVPVLSDVAVTFFSSFVVLTPHGNFWVVPVLHAASDVKSEQTACRGGVTSLGTGAGGAEQVSSSTYSPKLDVANRELLESLGVTSNVLTAYRHEK